MVIFDWFFFLLESIRKTDYIYPLNPYVKRIGLFIKNHLIIFPQRIAVIPTSFTLSLETVLDIESYVVQTLLATSKEANSTKQKDKTEGKTSDCTRKHSAC